MTTRREQILQALVTRLATDSGLPAAELDVPEPSGWYALSAGLAQALAVQDGPVTVTRDGGRDDDYECALEAMIVYAVQGADQAARRAARDSAVERIVAIIAANRQLGLGVQTYAEITGTDRDDREPMTAGLPMALAMITVTITFIAPSPAG